MKSPLFYLLAALVATVTFTAHSHAQDVVINEIAWMGTTFDYRDEWLELHNPTAGTVDLAGWTLAATDGTPTIALAGSLPPDGYFLLERTDDTSVPDLTADQIYTGALENPGEILELRDAGGTLVDRVGAWYAGDNALKASMSRISALAAGDDPANWRTATILYSAGFGTPRSDNDPVVMAVYFSDHLRTLLPGDAGPKAMARALIDAIDASTTSIDFALYGVAGSQQVIDALAAAADRGVAVRGVVDSYSSGGHPYGDTQKLIDALPPGAVVADDDNRLMHNKFFVFDGHRVWTGSTNVSDTGLYVEYNSNWSILIDDDALAAAYAAELEEMHAGFFHDQKSDDTQHVFTLVDGTPVECYFSPTDDAKAHAILRAIDGAHSTLDVRIFSFTDADVRDAVLAAKARGVAVRMIVDAAEAAGAYSRHQELRAAGIPVKVESWGGKEHMKAAVADGEVVILGSQNWTGAGNAQNDENTLHLRSSSLAAAFTAEFNRAWQSIPDVWLAGDPGAESADSPDSLHDFLDNDHDGLVDEGAPQALHSVASNSGAVNVYFNKSALTQCAENRRANHRVNLEDRLLARIAGTAHTIDLATYELNLPRLVDALLDKAAAGVDVRIIADAKRETEPGRIERYEIFTLYLEKLSRGADGLVGTDDDVAVFADSPIFAVEDGAKRTAAGLPESPAGLPWQPLEINREIHSGWVVAYGEYNQQRGDYYAAGQDMHNKFAVFDDTWVWTGSWNFTVTGLYGNDDNMSAGLLGGNSNHALEIRSPELAAIYTLEFEEMWGASGPLPDPLSARFHSRKTDNTAHEVILPGGRRVSVYFSPGTGDDALGAINRYVTEEADVSARFAVFAWSDQTLVNELKLKYEGSTEDLVGTRTGFVVEGVFDGQFWNPTWSAALDMRADPRDTTARWANPAPVFKDREDSKLHHKYMIVDGHSDSSPAVITGSANWSANADEENDENVLIIEGADVADQFVQEFAARYYQAGGELLCDVVGRLFTDGFESGDVSAWN